MTSNEVKSKPASHDTHSIALASYNIHQVTSNPPRVKSREWVRSCPPPFKEFSSIWITQMEKKSCNVKMNVLKFICKISYLACG